MNPTHSQKGSVPHEPAFERLLKAADLPQTNKKARPILPERTVGHRTIDDPGETNISRKRRAKMVSNEVIGRRLLNVREAAQYLGLEVDTVYKKSRLREVPCVKVGRALRFDVRALERYIEQHTIETID